MIDFEFLCLWADNSTSWQNTQDLIAGECDAVINDYLWKLQDTGNTESFKMIFDTFVAARDLNKWWETQIQKN